MAHKGQLLVDHFEFKAHILEDNSSKGGKTIARGEFARADVATENKRVYPRSLWEREIGRLDKSIQERKVYGELDHPMDGRTQLKRASHIITGLRLEGDLVVGEAEIMDTAEGRNLKAILDAGGKVGVSSRGFGTTRGNAKGEDVVQDDYKLMTFDFVAEPAMTTAYPQVTSESKPQPRAEAVMSEDITLDKLRASNPKLVESIMQDAEREYEKRAAEIWAKKISSAKSEAQTDLRATFAEQLQQALKSVRAEIAQEEREKLLSDPSVAAAKTALDNLKSILRPFVVPEDVEAVVKDKEQAIADLQKKFEEKDSEIAKLKEENERLAAVAKEAGYRYHLEKLLHDVPQSDLIRKLVGDVKQYESTDALNARISDIVDQIKEQSNKQIERDREMDRLREENARLRQATESSLRATQMLSVQNYVEHRLANHPRAAELRTLLESASSKDEVDSVLSKFRDRVASDPAALEEARARIRKMVGSGSREYLSENEERAQKGRSGLNEDYNGTGIAADHLRALAGIDKDQN